MMFELYIDCRQVGVFSLVLFRECKDVRDESKDITLKLI